MKPSSILTLLLVSALCVPALRAQDVPAKVREIEQKVLLQQYQNAIRALAGAAGEAGITPDVIARRLQWLTLVDGQIDPAGKASPANREEMTRNASALNELAWRMTTVPEDTRQPEIALKLATIALELCGENKDLKPNILDTRARALFMLGKRDEAVAEQQKAIAAEEVAWERDGFNATLALYRNNILPQIPPPGPMPADRLLLLQDVGPGPELRDLEARMEELSISRKSLEQAAEARSGTDMDKTIAAIKELNARLEKLRELQNQQAGNAQPQPQPQPEPKPVPQALPPQEEPSSGVAAIMEKLRNIVLPVVDFEDSSLEEAVDFLRTRCHELDVTERDPARRGLNFVIRKAAPAGTPAATPAPAGGGAAAPDATTDPGAIRIKGLHLRNVPLAVALKYVCDAGRLRFKVDDFAVTLVPVSEVDRDLFTRTFRVPADFTARLHAGTAGMALPDSAGKAPGSPSAPAAHPTLVELFKVSGISFGEGSGAVLTSNGMLMVTNTPTELDKIEQLIMAMTPEIETNGK